MISTFALPEADEDDDVPTFWLIFDCLNKVALERLEALVVSGASEH